MRSHGKPTANRATRNLQPILKRNILSYFSGGKDGKSFLLDRYPDGQGPDSNLIQMLEREVIDFNPNITFDDIAELETAKGLLQ